MFFKIGLISIIFSGLLQADINYNKEYKVSEVYGKSSINEILTLKLNDNFSFSGFDGCNRISGTYTKENEHLVVNNGIVSTRMFCADAIHSNTFNLALNNIKTFKKNKNKIELFDEKNIKILELTESN